MVNFPAGFHGTNPSLVRLNGQYLVCVRGVNYIKGRYGSAPSFSVGDRYLSANRFFLADNDLNFVRALPGLDSVFDGIEDIKLFLFDGTIMGSGSAADDEKAQRCINLLTIDPSLDGGSRSVLASPFGLDQEKNWAPFVHDSTIHFVYSFEPLVILRYDSVRHTVEPILQSSRAFSPRKLTFLMSGSSAGIAVGNDFLFVAHRRRVWPILRREAYLSRFYRICMPDMRLSAGRYFSIGSASVQFVNGLEQEGDDFILAYGEMDHTAHISRFRKSSIIAKPLNAVS
jgi:hypothetical protein